MSKNSLDKAFDLPPYYHIFAKSGRLSPYTRSVNWAVTEYNDKVQKVSEQYEGGKKWSKSKLNVAGDYDKDLGNKVWSWVVN